MRYMVPMDCRTGGCLGTLTGTLRRRERCVDPLWHIILHDHGNEPSLNRHQWGRSSLLSAVEHLRCERFWWYSGPRLQRDEQMLDWLSSTKLKDWLLGPRAFRAPSYWPDSIDSIWGRDVPTPWELANAFPACCYREDSPWWYGHDVSTLVAYACGMSVYEIREVVGVSERAVLSHMASGIEKLLDNGSFRLWLWNLDFTSLPATMGLSEPLLKRLKLNEDLKKNPLGVRCRDVRNVMQSPLFTSAAYQGLYPRRVGCRPIGQYVMICEEKE